MVQSAVPLKVIAEVLAHKSVATTNRYAHLNKDTLRDAMSVLNHPEK
jgi:site-specific recombinase XerD